VKAGRKKGKREDSTKGALKPGGILYIERGD